MEQIEHDLFESSGNNVIYITEEQRIEWNHDATKELLKLYDEKCDMLDSGIITTQKKLWEFVSKDMNKKGYYYTGAQCENKWKTLKRNYRNKLDKIDKYGSCKRQCPFENEITEILSKRPQESMFSRSYNYSPKYSRIKKDEMAYEVTLNDPPGFGEEHNTSISKQNVKLIQSNEPLDEEQLSADYITQEAGTSQIAKEISELRKSVIKQNKFQTEMMRQSNELQSKIVQYLDGATQRECQNLELEETRMEQQNEIIKQMKIQNSLLQKLLEKLG